MTLSDKQMPGERAIAILPGQYFDAESGLHQNWNRDYDPSLGRYLQSDPIGLAGGLSTYGYARANPINLSDIRGLQSGERAAAAAEAFWNDPHTPKHLKEAAADAAILVATGVGGEALLAIRAARAAARAIPKACPKPMSEAAQRAFREKLDAAEEIKDIWQRNQARLDAISEALGEAGYTDKQIFDIMRGLQGGFTKP